LLSTFFRQADRQYGDQVAAAVAICRKSR